MQQHVIDACRVLRVHPNDSDLAGSARRAYRKLAKEAHPDKGGDTVWFTAVTDAYRAVQEWLANPYEQQPDGFPNDDVIHVNIGGVGMTVPFHGHVHHHVDGKGGFSFTITMNGPLP